MLYIVSKECHDQLVRQAWVSRGYSSDEVRDVVRLCADAARHGIHTHNAIKALHIDEVFGSRAGGCVPRASVEIRQKRFAAAQVWNANRKMGPSVAYHAIDVCIELADRFGIGSVSVDNAFHYFWGGSYALEAARRGYIGYTQCTAMLAEVVPFRGRRATLGTNPHSWAFPTTEAVGFPVLVDWATSAVAMGRVQQLRREGKPLPPNCAVDADGQVTSDPDQAVALLPFGEHKGYGLGVVNELFAALIGGSLPTVRGRFRNDGEKHSPCFFFLVIHPDAISSFDFAGTRTSIDNLREIAADILGHGNERAILPGQLEATQAAQSDRYGGFFFSKPEIDAFNAIALECGVAPWRLECFTQVESMFEG